MSTDGAYEDHVAQEKSKYLLAYEEWENSLTPQEREMLGDAAAPELEDDDSSKRMVTGVLGDVAERPSVSYTPDFAAAVDQEPELIAELATISLRASRIVHTYMLERIEREAARRESRVITVIAGTFLRSQSNAKLLSAGLAFAAGLAASSGMGTMQDWAMQNGVSRAAVSKLAVFWRRLLGLPAGPHMREDSKCRAYSEAQKQKHWRKQKVGTGVLGSLLKK